MKEITNKKPKSIKNVGLILLALSGVALFCNIIILSTIFFIDKIDPVANKEFQIEPLFINLNKISLTIFITTGLYIWFSIKLIKFKNWARILLQVLSVVSIIEIWGLMMLVNTAIPEKDGLFSAYSITVSIIFSIPVILLIWFLRKKKNKNHFA